MSGRLTKRQKRILRQQGIVDEEGNLRERSFNIAKDIKPLTPAQKDAFEAWREGYNLLLHGCAGTGKSFLGMYFALSDIQSKHAEQRKVYIVRSTVPTRDQGFQPGRKNEKEAVYASPYPGIVNHIYGRGDAYDILKQKDMIEFTSTSFLRSVTIDDSYIVVDECQNMTFHELDTIITRAGNNTKFIFCGDTRQNDLVHQRKREESGLVDFMKILDTMEEFDSVQFYSEDIVRSGLVKNYIMSKEKLGL